MSDLKIDFKHGLSRAGTGTLTRMPRPFLVVRSDRHDKEFILGELEAGRLREGWSYDPSLGPRATAAKAAARQPRTDSEANLDAAARETLVPDDVLRGRALDGRRAYLPWHREQVFKHGGPNG